MNGQYGNQKWRKNLIRKKQTTDYEITYQNKWLTLDNMVTTTGEKKSPIGNPITSQNKCMRNTNEEQHFTLNPLLFACCHRDCLQHLAYTRWVKE